MASDSETSENAAVTEKPVLNKTWLFVALIALTAAFLFQWRNEIDQAAIVQTDSGSIVRAKVDATPGSFRIFYNGSEKIREVLLCDGDGNVLCKMTANTQTPEVFNVPAEAPLKEIRNKRFLRLVIPNLQSDGQPVVLLVKAQAQ